MFLWFIGTAIVTVRFVFRDPAFDYRLLIVGSVLPLADIVTGGAGVLHTLVFSLVLMVVVMLSTVGRRYGYQRGETRAALVGRMERAMQRTLAHLVQMGRQGGVLHDREFDLVARCERGGVRVQGANL